MIYFALLAGAVALLCGGACIFGDVKKEIEYYQNL